MKNWFVSSFGFQALSWLIVFLFLVLYGFHRADSFEFGVTNALIYTLFYALAVYAQSHWLFPIYGRNRRYGVYVLLSLGLLAMISGMRLAVEYFWIYLPSKQYPFFGITVAHTALVLGTQFLASLFGVLLRVAIDYLSLLRDQESIKAQQLQIELSLLKSQVQPHFLFNTLNNLYYLAYTKNEQTPEVIAKLSEIMRYFVDEAPKEKVLLSTEIQFIENYIALEKIRMSSQIQIVWHVEGEPGSLALPPMLLIPIVENIFKHGVDKLKNAGSTSVTLRIEKNELVFETINPKSAISGEVRSGGLSNLEKRLALLYGTRYRLDRNTNGNTFTCRLTVPRS